MYEITLQQEVLNEQAAQLMGDTINLLLAAREQEDAIAEAVYEDVLKQILTSTTHHFRRALEYSEAFRNQRANRMFEEYGG